MLDAFAGKTVYVIHDADKPGQEGATYVPRTDGTLRPGWAPCIARVAKECRNVVLPYPVEDTHGKDLRDWINEGHTYDDLLALAEAAEIVEPAAVGETETKPNEAGDDPHRLARVNLERYGTYRQMATIRYWRDEWYTWTAERGCYRRIGEKELRAKVSVSIKREFDRLNVEAIEEWNARPDQDKPPPFVRKVGSALVTNVLAATASMTVLSSSIEPMTWIDHELKQRRNYVSMANGILDIDKLLADQDDYLVPHSPAWFSMVRLPYAFDPEATCPKWEAFLERNLELDPERIKVLQEWAGYLLLPDTGQQKFLVMEGEGANGKSVYMAAVTGMLGEQNCSHIPFELFGDRFSKSQTLGKLVNISADAGEIDKVAEGNIKSFVSGDVVYFDRKGIDGINCAPTARLMIACNNRPRFSDKTSGIWRRMILVPWNIEIGEDEKIQNMDKSWWWQRQGELPGIFNWALAGLHRLRHQQGFTRSEVGRAALEDYQLETNPAKQFLLQTAEQDDASQVMSDVLYRLYAKWCVDNGYRPLGERQFGKEVRRAFPFTERKKRRSGNDRYYVYEKLNFCDEKLKNENECNDSLF